MLAQSLRAGSVAAANVPRPRRQVYSAGGRERSPGQHVHPSFEAFMAAPVSDDDDEDDPDNTYSSRLRKHTPPVRQSAQRHGASSFFKASAVSTEVNSSRSLWDSDAQSPGEVPMLNKQRLPLPSTSTATTAVKENAVSTSAASHRPQAISQLVVDDVTSGDENYSSFESSPTDVPSREATGSMGTQLLGGLRSPELTLTPDMRHSQRRSLVNAESKADATTKPLASALPGPNTVQRSLDFGQPLAAGPAALLKTLPAVSTLLSSVDLGTDSEAEEASKREFFARLERKDAPDAAQAQYRHSTASSLDTLPARDDNRAEALVTEAVAATVVTTPATGAAPTVVEQAAVSRASITLSSSAAPAAPLTMHAALQGLSDQHAESHGLQVNAARHGERDNAVRISLPLPSPQQNKSEPSELQGQTLADLQAHAQQYSQAEARHGAATERTSSKTPHAHPQSKALPKRAPSRQNTRSDFISPSSRGTAASTPLASSSTLQLSQQFAQLQEQVSAMTAADHKKDNRGALPRVTDWQSMAEELKAKLAEESALRKDLTRKLLEQKRAVELNEKRIRESYEARVRELQKEKNALALRLQELEHADPRQRILASKDKVVLEAHELAALRRDMQDQELLISGYQTENERMTEKLKEVQAQLKERESMLAQENARLASQLERTHGGVKSQASSFHRVLALEAELASAREEAAMREDELREQLQKAKHEAESATTTAHLTARNKELSRIVEELTLKMQSHAAEQQERLQASEQRAIELEQQLIASNGGEGRIQYASKLARANRRIHDLEAQVRTLQEQQAGSIENNKLQTLQQQLAALTTANRLQEEEATRSLLGLQQEHERMKRQYEKRLSQHQSKLDQPVATVRRVQELEKQIEELRTFYSKKLKEATQSTTKENPKQEVTKGGVKGGATKQALARARDKMKHLEDMLAAKDASIEALQAELQALHERVAESTHADHTMAHNATSHRASSPSHQSDSRPSSGRHQQPLDEDVARLQRSLEASELSREMLQRSYEEAVERSAGLKHEYEQVLQQLQEVQGEGSGAQVEQQQLRKELRAWRQRCEKAESELEDLRMQLKDGPMPAQYRALEKRISEMDARQQAREEQWRGILEETKRVAEMEGSLERHRHALTMEAKNAELARFRAELDAILETAVALQKQILPAHVSLEQESVHAA
eukprot:jgi/Chlat1/1941/Chrsp153S02248